MYSVIGVDGRHYGPVDIATLKQWCKEGRIIATTQLYDPISGRTFAALDLHEIRVLLTSHAPPTAPSYQAPYRHPTPFQPHLMDPYWMPKSRLAAGILAILLGCFGVHRFYLGHNSVGVAMLLITVLTCGYGSIITAPWALVEAILCFTGAMRDGKGMPLGA